VILYNDRVVIPPSLRQKVLGSLNAARQGVPVSAMERRARAIVFWPGMTHNIHRARNACVYCSRNALSQADPPPMPSSPPTTPFEQILADYFDYGGRHFLIIGDRFSGWADVLAILLFWWSIDIEISLLFQQNIDLSLLFHYQFPTLITAYCYITNSSSTTHYTQILLSVLFSKNLNKLSRLLSVLRGVPLATI